MTEADRFTYIVGTILFAGVVSLIVGINMAANASDNSDTTKVSSITCVNPVTGNKDTYNAYRVSHVHNDADIYLNSNVWVIKTAKYTVLYPVYNCVIKIPN